MVCLYPLRIYQEIGYIVIHKKVKTQDFINYYSLSNYQYNADAKSIQELERDYGICSTFGKEQISFEVTDPDLYDNTYRSLCCFFNQYDTHDATDSKFLLRFQILEMLLQKDGMIKIDEMVDAMGYARSTIRAPLKQAREYLSSYQIETESLPHHGIRVLQNELRIRRCLISLYNWFDINLIKRSVDPWLEFLQHEKYAQLVELADAVLKQENFMVQQIDRRKLRFYLVIQNERIKEGKQILSLESLDRRMIDYILQDTALIAAARHLCEALEAAFAFGPYTEQEILSVALFLFSGRKKEGADLAFITREYFQEYQDLWKLVCRCFFGRYGISFYNSEIHDDVASEIANLILQNHMKMLAEKGMRFHGRSAVVYDAPLMLQTAEELRRMLSEYYGYSVPLSHLIPLVDVFAYLIPFLPYHFPQVRVAIESRNSSYGAQLFARLIRQKAEAKWNNQLKVDCFEHDAAMLNGEQLYQNYDLVLCDHPLSGEKAVVYTSRMTNLDQLLYMSRDLCFDTLKARDGVIRSEDLAVQDEAGLMAFLAEKKSDLFSEQDRAHVHQAVSYQNRMAVMILNGKGVRQNCLVLGNLQTPISFFGQEVDKYVFLAAELSQDNILFYNTFLSELAGEGLFFYTLRLNPDFQVVNDRLNVLLQ